MSSPQAKAATLFDVIAELPNIPAARFRPCSQYAATEFPWLGKVPTHWGVRRLKTALARNDGGGSAKGATTCEQLGNLQVPHSPHSEQVEISEHVSKHTARIDELSESVHAALATIAEYRSALISAAVTGKVDVRGEVTGNQA